jgi:hypothetical protein
VQSPFPEKATVKMGINDRSKFTYISHHSTTGNGTISDDPIDVPEEDMSTNLIFQMIDNQKEKRGNKRLTGKWIRTGAGAGTGAGANQR